jgi:hypothetical protein
MFCLNRVLKVCAIGVGIFAYGISGVPATARVVGYHPARAEVSDRLQHQNIRIDRDAALGRIT